MVGSHMPRRPYLLMGSPCAQVVLRILHRCKPRDRFILRNRRLLVRDRTPLPNREIYLRVPHHAHLSSVLLHPLLSCVPPP